MSALAEAKVVRHLHRVPAADPVVETPTKAAAVARRAVSLVRGDVGRWWLRTLNPPDLTTWLRSRTPARVPADDTALSWAWRVDHWTTGLVLVAVSSVLFLSAAGIRWVACHPARRWLFLFLAAACGTYLWLA